MLELEILWILAYAGIVALIANFLLLLAYKLGIVEWLQVHGNDIVSKMAHCDFCMSWWISVFLTVVLLVAVNDVDLLIVPVIATPLARKLL